MAIRIFLKKWSNSQSHTSDFFFRRLYKVIIRWCPLVINWFKNPMNILNISPINHCEIGVICTNWTLSKTGAICTNWTLSKTGAPPCRLFFVPQWPDFKDMLGSHVAGIQARGVTIHCQISGILKNVDGYPPVNVNKKLWKDPPFSSWENRLFRLDHF